MKKKLHISYNAPVVLTFILICLVVLVVGSLIIKLIRKGLTKADRFTSMRAAVTAERSCMIAALCM